VGPENHHIAMKDYSLHMNMIAFLRKQFPNVKLSLHAGELVLGMVPPEGLRFHINQAVNIAKANRIGHGVDIAHEANAAELLALMSKNQVVVEVNITSNKDILGVKGGDHPLSIYRAYKVPYVISTDDPGVSRNNLSGEYQLYMATFRPSYDELKNTIFNSIRYSFLSDQEKSEEIKKLDSKFRDFESAMSKYPKR
jgi:adenosine deaminase/adenosine deaminase CECR1